MTKELILVQELLHAKMINAKREKEAHALPADINKGVDASQQFHEWSGREIAFQWSGQEIAFRQMLDILTKVIGK